MKATLMILLLSLIPTLGFAEEKECKVKGMHCGACADMVKEKVCTDGFAVCDVKMGLVHIKTKDTAAKIDEKALAQALADTTYKLEKCAPTKGKSTM